MNILNMIILAVGLLTILIGLLVLIKNYKNPSNIWYFWMCFFGGSWGIVKAVQFSVNNVYWHDLLISRLVMFFGAMAPLAYVMLTVYFIYKIRNISKNFIFFLVIISIILGGMNLLGILRHADILIIDNVLHRDIILRDFLIFAIYYFVYVFIGFYVLLKKYYIAEGVNKNQIRYLIYSTVGNFLTTGIVSVILLLFNNFKYDYLGPIFLLINFFVVGWFVFIKPINS